MKILIREGSAAKNFEALYELIEDHPSMIMLCSDDKHPDSLVEGHINSLCARAVAKGIDPLLVLRAACINPVDHYKLPTGKMQVGDAANFIVLDDPTNHLDIDSRETLLNALKEFDGTVMIVSHDRYFLRSFVNRVFEIDHCEMRIYDGTYDYYLEKTKV
jgi:adenine deaminase